jgi:lipopolysaccharide/colanic/teichoic acid biosynthesis glycosyltransferase
VEDLLSTNSLDFPTSQTKGGDQTTEERLSTGASGFSGLAAARDVVTLQSSRLLFGKPLSSWSRSTVKRVFDCACVLPTLPLLLPVLAIIAVAVRLTSRGPVFFLQQRMGRDGKSFTIVKFRTMLYTTKASHRAVTTAKNQRFTPIGPFLRRWKLDELPQMLNVLAGHMSLVGPRPKMPEHVKASLPCRPGITGAATIAFALEESVLDRIPKHQLEDYYHRVVLPTKRKLDADYMSQATFGSDLRLIINSVIRRWDTSLMEDLLNSEAFESIEGMELARARAEDTMADHLNPPPIEQTPIEQVSGF